MISHGVLQAARDHLLADTRWQRRSQRDREVLCSMTRGASPGPRPCWSAWRVGAALRSELWAVGRSARCYLCYLGDYETMHWPMLSRPSHADFNRSKRGAIAPPAMAPRLPRIGCPAATRVRSHDDALRFQISPFFKSRSVPVLVPPGHPLRTADGAQLGDLLQVGELGQRVAGLRASNK